MPVFDLVAFGKVLFKVAFFGALVAMLYAFSIWFVDFTNQVYTIFTSASTAFAHSSMPDTVVCAMSALGIDVWINSAFSIFYTAAQFWIIAVGYIITYKLSGRAYDGLLKVLS